VVNNYHLVIIVVINDNRIDGQLPNGVKTKFLPLLFLFVLCVYVKGIKRCACLCVCMSLCSDCEFRFVFSVHVFSFFFLSSFFISLSHFFSCYYAVDWYLTLMSNCYYISSPLLFFVIGLIYFYSLRILVYVCLSVYILHQFVTVVDKYIKWWCILGSTEIWLLCVSPCVMFCSFFLLKKTPLANKKALKDKKTWMSFHYKIIDYWFFVYIFLVENNKTINGIISIIQ